MNSADSDKITYSTRELDIAKEIAAIDDKKPPIAHYCDGGLIFSSHQFFAFGEVVEEGGVKGF